jgi:dienelactone hydrolase
VSPPHLGVAAPRGAARGIAVVLHGGRSNSRQRVRRTQLAVLRMYPFVRALRRLGPQGLVVAELRYQVRGWNGAERSPVADVEWALQRLTTTYPDVPIALVGHSMGGRAALYSAGWPAVRAVVGLAPWIEPDDPVAQLAGRRVLIAHGDRDRMTDPRASAAYARAAHAIAESISYVTVRGEAHAMLRRPAIWTALTTGFVSAAVLDAAPRGTESAEVADLVARALAGTAGLVV